MPFDYRVALFACLAMGAITFAVSLMPPLTDGGGTGASDSVSQAEYEATVAAELAFCESQPDAVNCQCFAQRSGAILTHAPPEVPGMFYADKQQLARGQAARGC